MMIGNSATISAARGNFSVAKAYAASTTSATSNTTTTGASSESSVVTLSDAARKLLGMREVSDGMLNTYQSLLNRAQSSNALQDPKAFLKTLSTEELGVLQKAASLAEPIDVGTLSNEGAYNLLVPPDQTHDLDNNGLTQVGVGNLFTFPPENAPQSFKDAWKKTTEGMEPGSIPCEMIFAVGFANLRQDPQTGETISIEPGDPRWVNPYASADYDYGKEIERIQSGLKFELEHGYLTQAQYNREHAFYTKLTAAMETT